MMTIPLVTPSYYERLFEELTAPQVNVSTESPHWDWKWADIEADMCVNTAEPTVSKNARLWASDLPEISSDTDSGATVAYAADYPDVTDANDNFPSEVNNIAVSQVEPPSHNTLGRRTRRCGPRIHVCVAGTPRSTYTMPMPQVPTDADV